MSFARKLKKKQKATPKESSPMKSAAGTREITLSNPVSNHFGAFIVGNAASWQEDAMADIARVAPPHVLEDIRSEFDAVKPGTAYAHSIKFQAGLDAFCDEGKRYVVQENEAAGKHVVICGAGPSLAENVDRIAGADQVWGCNSALAWLIDHGHPVTHGFTVDQTPQMVNEWRLMPDVEYLVCSTIHPHLTELLKASGRRRRWFHNFVGIDKRPVRWTDHEGNAYVAPYEHWLYLTLFPGTIMSGSGLNTVTRAIDIARHMGFATITVLGADCAIRTSAPRPDGEFGTPEYLAWLKEHTVMHADGGSAIAGDQTPLTMSAEIDDGTEDDTIRPGCGRIWTTKPDLIVSALWLHGLAKKFPETVELVGDTLPHALRNKNTAYLKRLPNFSGADGESMLPEFI